jgi:hypothetical protein
MLTFTDEERMSLTENRALTTDSQGRELLVGLTADETEALMNHRRKVSQGDRDRTNRKYCLELHHKHELARLEVVGTEIYVRAEKPSQH